MCSTRPLALMLVVFIAVPTAALLGVGCSKTPQERRTAEQETLRAERLRKAQRGKPRKAPSTPPRVVYVPGPATAKTPGAGAGLPPKPAPPPAPAPGATPPVAGPAGGPKPKATGPVPTTPLSKLPSRTLLLHKSLRFQVERRRSTHVTVSYETWAKQIHAYYKRVVRRLGWKKTADFSPGERTKCGGDWGGYYQRKGARMRFHLCGPQSVRAWEGGRMRKQPVLRTITITTYGFHPRQLLGRDYKRRVARRRP